MWADFVVLRFEKINFCISGLNYFGRFVRQIGLCVRISLLRLILSDFSFVDKCCFSAVSVIFGGILYINDLR